MITNNCYSAGEKADRPWGGYKVLAIGLNYVVKEIVVSPGQKLSYQSHCHRYETWTIIAGTAIVTLHPSAEEETTETLLSGEAVYIIPMTKHRVYNPSPFMPLVFIEVQTGEYLDEKDIIRYNDDYGRVKNDNN